jgi:hypothetical protein
MSDGVDSISTISENEVQNDQNSTSLGLTLLANPKNATETQTIFMDPVPENKKEKKEEKNVSVQQTLTTEKDLFPMMSSSLSRASLSPENKGQPEETQPKGEHSPVQRQSIPQRKKFSKDDYQKVFYLSQLKQMQKRGVEIDGHFSMNQSLEELEEAFEYAKYLESINDGGNLAKGLTIGICSGLEFVNRKFDPFGIDLEGWAGQLSEDLDDKDAVFQELALRWNMVGRIPPEATLAFAICSSAYKYSLKKQEQKPKISRLRNVHDVASRVVQEPTVNTDTTVFTQDSVSPLSQNQDLLSEISAQMSSQT